MTALVVPAAPGVAPPRGLGLALAMEQAVPMFLEYLTSYRSCSPLSIRSYAADLRGFQEFLAARGPLPTPAEITRHLVIQYAVTLSHLSPVTIRKKLSCLSSLFGFLQDMGHVAGNPARRLPLPQLEQHVPVTLSRVLLEDAPDQLRDLSGGLVRGCGGCPATSHLTLLEGLDPSEARWSAPPRGSLVSLAVRFGIW